MNTTAALPEALREALGQVIATQRREWARERELIEAQSREAVAELRARIIELEAQVRERVADRIASVRDGVDGKDGRDGIEGRAGKDGEPGRDGVDGKDGEKGADGIDGRDGANGKDGEPGHDGVDGRDADPEEIARVVRSEVRTAVSEIPAPKDGLDGRNGENGRDGKDGQDGADGQHGKDGSDGQDGKDGIDGRNGDNGIGIADLVVDGEGRLILTLSNGERKDLGVIVGRDGQDGRDGKDGADGVDGKDGIDGANGKDGIDGERGLEGAPGKLPLCADWSEGVHYEGDVVVFDGALYQAQKDTGRTPTHADWRCLARHGRDGRSFRICGTFDSERAYAALDVVMLSSSSFVATKDDPGPCPGPGWQLHAGAGRRGEKGERGERGAAGERGSHGERGENGPFIVAWRDNVDDYAATPILSDGSEGPPLDIRSYLERFVQEAR